MTIAVSSARCAHAVERRLEGRLHVVPETLAAARLLAEGLHGADAAERLLQVSGDAADAVLGDAGMAAHAPTENDDGDHHQGHHQHHVAGERRARHHQHRARAHEHQQVAQRRRCLVADQRLQQAGVGGDAREQLAHLVDLEEGRAEAHQAAEDRPPDVGDHPLAEPGDQVEAGEGAGGQQRDHARHVDQGLVEALDLLAAEAVVDQHPQALAEGEDRRSADAERRERRHHDPAVGPQVAEEGADLADLAARGGGRARRPRGGARSLALRCSPIHSRAARACRSFRISADDRCSAPARRRRRYISRAEPYRRLRRTRDNCI